LPLARHFTCTGTINMAFQSDAFQSDAFQQGTPQVEVLPGLGQEYLLTALAIRFE